MYLRQCRYTETFDGYDFTGPCILTGKEMTVHVKSQELYQLNQGALIQDALVSNTDDEREFLLSGLSPEGWAILYPPEKEDEEEEEDEHAG